MGRRAINSSEKILYLLQYLSGTPRNDVEGYQFVSTPDAYETAKRVLEKRFNHPSVVAQAFRDKLESWQRILPKDGTALMEFADFLRTCELAMQSVEDLETLNKESDNKKLMTLLVLSLLLFWLESNFCKSCVVEKWSGMTQFQTT